MSDMHRSPETAHRNWVGSIAVLERTQRRAALWRGIASHSHDDLDASAVALPHAAVLLLTAHIPHFDHHLSKETQ